MSVTNFKDVIAQGSKFAPEAGRYILYVSLGCPFALRPAIARNIKDLNGVIQLCVVDYHYAENGLLQFSTPDRIPECTPDPVMGAKFLRDLYLRACPDYQGIFSVPVLWDQKLNTIVNNESEDIMRMFDSAFGGISESKIELYPKVLQSDIEEWNSKAMKMMVLAREAGSAAVQEEYESKANELKDLLLDVESTLGKSSFLLGSRLTEADVRIFISVLRHDIINVLLCRVNHIYVRDLPNTMGWIKDILDISGMRELIKPKHIKGLTFSKKAFNPNGIIPLGDGFVLP